MFIKLTFVFKQCATGIILFTEFKYLNTYTTYLHIFSVQSPSGLFSDRSHPGTLTYITYMRKDDNLFMVDIDRIGQGCVAPSEQVVNNVVTTLLQLNNAVVTTVLSQMKYIPDV